MSAERRRHDDRRPGHERASHDDWPGDSQADQAWASSYRFDGRRSDEPWRDPSQRSAITPAERAWQHDSPADRAEDDWTDRTPVDQSWRYRSLADHRLDDHRLDDHRLDDHRLDDHRLDDERGQSPGNDGRGDGGRRHGGPGHGGRSHRGETDRDGGTGGRPGGRRRILVSVLAAVAVAIAFGAYGLVRLHDGSAVALQDASSTPCAAHAGQCRSHRPKAGPGGSSPVASNSAVPPPRSEPPHSAPPTPSASASPTTGTASSAAAGQVLALINQARAQQGRPALAISPGLNASSAAHTSDMASGCGLSHQCPGEPDLGTRLTNAGVQWTSAGENIGEGGPVADNPAAITRMAVSLTQSMLAERPPNDGHRMNILSTSFRFIGITVLLDSSGTVWMTQDFSG
jgi:uncharacterized protein YkwD